MRACWWLNLLNKPFIPNRTKRSLWCVLALLSFVDSMFAICEVGFLDHLSLQRAQLASSPSLVQTLEKWFERLRVKARSHRSQQEDEGGSGSCGTRRPSRQRTQGPSDEDENNQPRRSLANHGNLLCVVFLLYCLFIFLFTCLFFFWVRDLGVFKKLL